MYSRLIEDDGDTGEVVQANWCNDDRRDFKLCVLIVVATSIHEPSRNF